MNMPDDYVNIYSEREVYFDVCNQLLQSEELSAPPIYYPQRWYWIHAKDKDCLVGSFKEFFLPTGIKENAFAIGLFYNPCISRVGICNGGGKSRISSHVLDKNLAQSLCVETESDNYASARVLQKSGFSELSQELCRTSNTVDHAVRRFINSQSSQPAVWPFSTILMHS